MAAIKKGQTKKMRWPWVAGVVGALAIGAGGVAVYVQKRVEAKVEQFLASTGLNAQERGWSWGGRVWFKNLTGTVDFAGQTYGVMTVDAIELQGGLFDDTVQMEWSGLKVREPSKEERSKAGEEDKFASLLFSQLNLSYQMSIPHYTVKDMTLSTAPEKGEHMLLDWIDTAIAFSASRIDIPELNVHYEMPSIGTGVMSYEGLVLENIADGKIGVQRLSSSKTDIRTGLEEQIQTTGAIEIHDINWGMFAPLARELVYEYALVTPAPESAPLECSEGRDFSAAAGMCKLPAFQQFQGWQVIKDMAITEKDAESRITYHIDEVSSNGISMRPLSLATYQTAIKNSDYSLMLKLIGSFDIKMKGLGLHMSGDGLLPMEESDEELFSMSLTGDETDMDYDNGALNFSFSGWKGRTDVTSLVKMQTDFELGSLAVKDVRFPQLVTAAEKYVMFLRKGGWLDYAPFEKSKAETELGLASIPQIGEIVAEGIYVDLKVLGEDKRLFGLDKFNMEGAYEGSAIPVRMKYQLDGLQLDAETFNISDLFMGDAGVMNSALDYAYNPDTQEMRMNNFFLSSSKNGSVALNAVFGNIGRELLSSDVEAISKALAPARFQNLHVRLNADPYMEKYMRGVEEALSPDEEITGSTEAGEEEGVAPPLTKEQQLQKMRAELAWTIMAVLPLASNLDSDSILAVRDVLTSGGTMVLDVKAKDAAGASMEELSKGGEVREKLDVSIQRETQTQP